METSPANEIKEYNKLGICMKSFANYFGMACACNKCMEDLYKFMQEIDILLKD